MSAGFFLWKKSKEERDVILYDAHIVWFYELMTTMDFNGMKG